MTLRRKTPLRRGARGAGLKPLKPTRSSPIKRKKRSPREFARVYGSEERVLWVQSLPCCRCGRRPSENAHTENGGRGRKADSPTVAPLCRPCHRAYDEHRAPFNEPEARAAVRRHAEFTAAQWDRMANLAPLSSLVPRVLADLLDGEDAT